MNKIDNFVAKIADETSCVKHSAPEGTACFYIRSDQSEAFYTGVCNNRAKRAGYKHPIDPRSLSRGPVSSQRPRSARPNKSK